MILLVLLCAISFAQTLDESLNNLFGDRGAKQKSVSGFHWLDKGSAYSILESDSREIARYDTVSGRRSVLLPRQQHEISAYELSANLTRVLIFTNTRKVWRENTRGDYWIIDRSKNSARKLGGNSPEASLMFAKFSPNGSHVAYVREHNLYVEDVAAGAITQLTNDGSETIINGTSDWVYEEEFSLRDGFRWSPDSSSILYFQFDSSTVGRFPLVNATDSTYPQIQWIRYPKVGTPNSAVRAGVIPVTGGPTRWIQTTGDPRTSYLPRVEWANNSNELVLQHVNRAQKRNEVMLASAKSGRTRSIYIEQDPMWLDIVDEIQWIRNGKEFLWLSESEGWLRAYAVLRDGYKQRAITPHGIDVAGIAGTDPDDQWLYYIASPSDATQRHLFRTRLDGTHPPEKLSKGRGWHSYLLSPDGRHAMQTVTTFDSPSVSAIVKLPSLETVRVLEDNTAFRNSIAGLLQAPAEFFRLPIGDGVELDGWMIKPHNFRPDKKYPLLLHVYTEPFDLTATDRLTTRALFHRALAREGYVVVSLDNRGTPSLKGRAWRKAIYPTIGPLSSREQAAATQALLSTRPYLDPARVAVWGWSGGGTSTLNLMFRYPNLFKVGMSVAPVPDQRLYDTVYQERYMQTPDTNAAGYTASSPIYFAAALKGKLLIMHGTGDDNVHWQGTQLLADKLVELGKQFDMVVYPNRTHALSEGKGSLLHVHTTLARYLKEHLPPTP